MTTEHTVDRHDDLSQLPHLRLPGIAHQLSPQHGRPSIPSSSTYSAPSRMMLRPFSASSPTRAVDSPAEEPDMNLVGQATPSLVVTETHTSGARVRPSFAVDTPALVTPALVTPAVGSWSSARQLEGDAFPFPSMPLVVQSHASRNQSDPTSSTRRSFRPAVPFALADSPTPSWPGTPEGSSEGSATPDSLSSESSCGPDGATTAPTSPLAARALLGPSPGAGARSRMRSPLVSKFDVRNQLPGATHQERLRMQRELAASPASGSGEETSSASSGAPSPWQTPGPGAPLSADWSSSSIVTRLAPHGASTRRHFKPPPHGVRSASSSSSGSDWRPGELSSRFSDWTPSDSPPVAGSSQALRASEQQQDDDELFGMLPAVLERGPHARSAGHPLLDLSPHAATSAAAPPALVPQSSAERARLLLRLRALSLEVTTAPRDADLRSVVATSGRGRGATASRRNSTGGETLRDSGAAG
ncbi:uncharacterized protein RHOBADRAFT_54941 [Rhodotorula graminis WP1]|uniref:Uncharacterized protein n=1 Tax=Rhodotorula graminis (strain WP1) TaxID=578459 RepID=A0A0P9IVM5_RHOGW|nr:uncharacterized protein RHOBADRAFT_54941 [Rhodotorula graminis WP1]KPV73759.1 hypothetical protein RHOBADRAFT_54941 [Rhodotorula graminis WP1]